MAVQLAIVLGFLVMAGLALLAMLLFGKLLRPSRTNEEKASTYECGERPVGAAWFNFNNRFYLIALVFVVFDVEVALVVPPILIFRKWVDQGLGWLALGEVFFFLGVMLVALAYFWMKGDFRWIQDLKLPECAPVEIGDSGDKEAGR